MTGKQFNFFATKNDLLDVFDLVAKKATFKICCLDDGNEYPHIYKSIGDIDDLAIAKFGDVNLEMDYLLIKLETQPVVRRVEQRKGGVNFFLDQAYNPNSIAILFGGLMDSSNCIIAGRVGTISKDEWSNNIYKILFSNFKKNFTKIRSSYVGKEAEEKLDQGYRLTTGIKSPELYDLRR